MNISHCLKLFIAAIIFLSANLIAFSNNSDTIIVSKRKTILVADTTQNCKLVTFSKNIYLKVNLFELKDSSVKILDNYYSYELSIDSIQSITFYERGFWTGAAIGGGIGMLLGLIGGGDFSITGDGSKEYKFGSAIYVGFLLGIPLALIGGAIGADLAQNDIHDFSTISFAAKRKKLIYLMKKYADK
ncbi:MAG: hypothetical protein ABI840_08600 [bacterium]